MFKTTDNKVLLVLVLFQAVLCFAVVGAFPISLDEPFSIYHSQFPIGELLEEVSKGNNSPLHFVLLHGWIKVFGTSAIAVRSLSILVSLITLVVLFKLSRKFFNLQWSSIVVLLFVFSRLDHYVAMEARMYGCLTLFFVLILYDLFRLIFEDKRVFIQLGVWNALLLYTHYLGGVIILMECLIFLAYFKRLNKSKWGQAIGSFCIGGVLFVPGIAVFLNRASDFNASGTWVPDVVVADLWTNLVKLLNNQFTLIVVVVFLTVAIYLQRSKGQVEKKVTAINFPLAWFLGTYFLIYLLSLLVQPIFFIKYLQFLTIPLIIALVGIWSQTKLDQKRRWLFFLVVVPFALSFKPVPDINRNTDELVAFVRSEIGQGGKVYYCPPHYGLTLAYHYDRVIFEDYYNTGMRMLNAGFIPVYSHEDVFLEQGKLIFIDFDSKLLYPNNGILSKLDLNCQFIASETFKGDFHVYVYSYEN